MNLEAQLARALRRESAPEGFAGRAAERVRLAQPESVTPSPVARLWRAAAAVMLMGAMLAGWEAQRVAQRRQGERARAEVLLALRIAGAKIRTAQRQVREISSR